MFFFFGWGKQKVKKHGLVFERLCDHCKNQKLWELDEYTTWLSLFFIPVIPYAHKYFVSCPICHYGFQLKGGQIKQLVEYAKNSTLMVKGKITEQEFNMRINEINQKMIEGKK